MTTHHGILFKHHAYGMVRLELTLRSDLAVDRLVGRRGSDLLGVVQAPTFEAAKKLRRVLERAFCPSGSGNTMPAASVADALDRCRRLPAAKGVFLVHGLDASPVAQVTPTITNRITIVRRVVQDPMLDGEQLRHELDEHDENPRWQQPGYIRADVNLASLIGGLSRVKGISEAQREGAKDFRTAAEQAQIGGARAIDYSKARVDTSGPVADLVETMGADARSDYASARSKLGAGTLLLAVAERVIVDGQSIVECAESLGLGSGGAARKRVRRAAFAAATTLARHYGHDRHNDRSRLKFVGERPDRFTADGQKASIASRG